MLVELCILNELTRYLDVCNVLFDENYSFSVSNQSPLSCSFVLSIDRVCDALRLRKLILDVVSEFIIYSYNDKGERILFLTEQFEIVNL